MQTGGSGGQIPRVLETGTVIVVSSTATSEQILHEILSK